MEDMNDWNPSCSFEYKIKGREVRPSRARIHIVGPVTLLYENTRAPAVERFRLPDEQDFVVQLGMAAGFAYDPCPSRWLFVECISIAELEARYHE